MIGLWLLLFLFLVLHTLILYVVYRLLVKKVAENQRGVLMTIFFMSAFIPIVGELLGVISYVIARRFASSKTLLDYDEYIQFETLNLERLQQQAKEDGEMVPLTDALKMDAKKRKQSMTQLMTSSLVNTEQYLQIGLDHEDSETVHYAATVRNTLFDRYESAIKQKEAQLDPSQLETYYTLIETCETFIRSGLLDENTRQRVEERLKSYLKQLGELDSTDFVYLKTAGQLALQDSETEGSASEGVLLLRELISYHPQRVEGYLSLIEYHMTKGDWAELRPLLNQMKQSVPMNEVPEDKQFILERLEGVTH